jgi:hypothetical protein
MSQVGDYNIANASGASVRSDINAVLDAIKTFNSGGSDPANPEAFMPYVDTADSNKLKIRNASNNGFTTVGSVNEANLGLLPRAGGTMTGQLLGDDSSVAGSPAYAFDNDTDTGMFRSAANQVAFTCAGTKISHFSSAGLFITSTGSATTGIFLNDADNSAHISLKAPDVVSSNITYKLPASITNGGFLQTDGSGNLSFQVVAGVPIGSVFCIAHTTVPSGYLECNGASLPNGTGTVQGVTANFAALRALVGANLPDLRGEFIRGFDNGRGVDSGRGMLSTQGSQFGQHNHNVSASSSGSVGSHRHKYAFAQGSNGGIGTNFGGSGIVNVGQSGGNLAELEQSGGNDGQHLRGYVADSDDTQPSLSVSTSINQNNRGGTSNSSETRPRSVAMMYIIKF